MNKIILPDIVAAGVYNSKLTIGDKPESRIRTTTMFEIELPIENSGFTFVDDESSAVNINTIICAKPNQKRHTARLPFTCHYIHLQVEEGLLCEKLYNMPTFIPTENREDYLELFIEIEKSFETKLEIDTLLLQSLVLKLIHSLEKESEKQNKYRYFKSDKARAIDNIISYVKSDLTRNLCLDAISEYISISPIYLHRIFKEATGVTLREFVEEERLKKAVLLLTTTELNLTEIAFECGFSSQSYFSSVFKRKMNMSPRRYVKYLSEKYFENNKKL